MTTDKRQELNPDVRQRIETAVLNIFAREDFHKASMRDVAREASVSFETIYTHYSSKEKLLFAVVDSHMQKLVASVFQNILGIEDIREKLWVIFRTSIEFYERNSQFSTILFTSIPLKSWIKDETFRQDEYAKALIDIMKNGQEKGLVIRDLSAALLFNFFNVFLYDACLIWLLRGQKERLTDQAPIIFDMFWRGVSTTGGHHDSEK